MKSVEMWRWRIRDLTGKLITTRHAMDAETALARHPEAVRVPGTMELRQIAETAEEISARAMRTDGGIYRERL